MSDDTQGVAQDQLRSFVERILRLKEEQDTIGDDIKEVYAEAKGSGYDKTALGKLVAEIRARVKNSDKVDELDAILDVYRNAYFSRAGIDLAGNHVARAPAHTHEAAH